MTRPSRSTVAVSRGGVGAARFLRGIVRVVDAAARSPRSSTPATTPSCTGWRSRPTSTRSRTRSPGRSIPSAAGGSPARRGRRWRRSTATPRCGRPDRRRRRRGSTSATATWRRTCTARLASARAPRSTDVTAEIAPGMGRRHRAAADDRRSAAHDGRPRRRRDRVVPGLLRAAAPRRAGQVGQVRPRRRAARRARRAAALDDGRRRRDRPVEPARVDRADPGPARCRRAARRATRVGRRRVADRRRRRR